ncbi:alpha/beta hydrolase [Leptolyngbya sp. FACHB-261]|nr:alpha/beta hydrolase [Leptolyngbya sp. FACHB-261]
MLSDALAGQAVQLRQGVVLQVSHSPGCSPALVFLHGGLGNRFNWRSQYEFAQAQGWEALAYDLAGHGQSSAYRRYSLGRHQRDLSLLLQRFDIRAPVLCCHSYGVPLGLEWAHRHSVSALIVIGGGTHDLDPWWEVPLIKFLAWGGRYLYYLPSVQKLTNRLSSPYHHSVMERFFAESPLPTQRAPYTALQIFWGYNFFRRHLEPLNSQVPVLVISGDQDPMFMPAMGASLASLFPQGKHLNVANAGHLVMAEQPEIINQAIAEVVQSVVKV